MSGTEKIGTAGRDSWMSKEFIQRLLEKANRRALEIEDGESEGTAGEILAEMSETKVFLLRFKAASSVNEFSAVLSEAGLNEAASKRMTRVLSDKWTKEPLAALTEALKAPDETASAFERCVEREEMRARLTGIALGAGGSMSEATREGLGRFAPLLDFLENSLLPAEKAEMMSKMLAYVRSGQAKEDMISGWKSLDAFSKRLAEVSLGVKHCEAVTVIAGPKTADGKIRVVALMATSLPKMADFGNEMARCLDALRKETRTGETSSAIKGAQLDFHLLAPCLVNLRGPSEGKALLRRVEEGRRVAALDVLNALPMTAAVCHGFETPGDAFEPGLTLAGAPSGRWAEARERVTAAPSGKRDDQAVGEFARILSEALGVLSETGLKVSLRPDARNVESEGLIETVTRRVLESARRTHEWANDLAERKGLSETTLAALAEAGARLDGFQRERLSFVGDRKGHARLPWAAIAKDMTTGMAEA